MKTKLTFILIILFSLGCTKTEEAKSIANITPIEETILFDLPLKTTLLVVAEKFSLKPTLYTQEKVKFRITPNLPIGLSLNEDTGEIKGVMVLPQSKTRYVLSLTSDAGLSTQKEFVLEVRPDISLVYSDTQEVTDTSGKSVNLNSFIKDGKGNYQFSMRDLSFGTVTLDGIFTPNEKDGTTEILVRDNFGLGTEIVLTIKIGVPKIKVTKVDPRESEPARVVFSLSGKTAKDIKVIYSINRVTAMSSTVEEKTNQELLIPKGSLVKEISVPTYKNDIYKPDTSFSVNLLLDENAQFDGSVSKQMSVNIVVQNMVEIPEVAFEKNEMEILEFDETFKFSLKLNRKSILPISVKVMLDKNVSTVSTNEYVFLDKIIHFPTYQEGDLSEPTVEVSGLVYHDRNGNLPQDPDRLMSFLIYDVEGARLSQKNRLNMNIKDPLLVDIEQSKSDFVLLDELRRLNWNDTQDVIVRIKKDATISSSNTYTAAFSSGYIPRSTTTVFKLLNYGKIYGGNGRGGKAIIPVSLDGCNLQKKGEDGENGGDAISVTMPLRIENYGEISGGGGGGGGGYSAFISDLNCLSGEYAIGSDGADGEKSASMPLVLSDYNSKGGDGGKLGEPGNDAGVAKYKITTEEPGKGGRAGRSFSVGSERLIDLYNYGTVKGP